MTNITYDEMVEALIYQFTIEGYLDLRKNFPEKDIPLQIFVGEPDTFRFAGVDVAFQMKDDFNKLGITIQNYIGTLDGVEADIDNLCLECLKALSERKKIVSEKSHAVANGEVIGDAFIDFLIGVMLESISSHEIPLPPSFQVLVKVRLGIFDNKIKVGLELKERKKFVANFIAANPDLSMRSVAEKVGVNVSSISKWHKEKDFQFSLQLHKDHLAGTLMDRFKKKVLPKE